MIYLNFLCAIQQIKYKHNLTGLCTVKIYFLQLKYVDNEMIKLTTQFKSCIIVPSNVNCACLIRGGGCGVQWRSDRPLCLEAEVAKGMIPTFFKFIFLSFIHDL